MIYYKYASALMCAAKGGGNEKTDEFIDLIPTPTDSTGYEELSAKDN